MFFTKTTISSGLLVALLIICCKHKQDNPSPSGNNLPHSIDAVKPGNVNTSYSYDGNNRITGSTSTDTLGHVLSFDKYVYNEDELLYSYTSVNEKYPDTTVFHYQYNANKQVLTRTEYSDIDASLLVATTSYFYDGDNMSYYLKTSGSGNHQSTDSIVFSAYANGRPSIKMRFYKPYHSSYSFEEKDKYTYDARMNLIKAETGRVADSSMYYTAYEATYTTLSEQVMKSWNNGSTNVNIEGDEINANSKNNNVDFLLTETSHAELFACPPSAQVLQTSDLAYEILDTNATGYIDKFKLTSNFYSCGSLQNNTTQTYEVTY